MADTKDFLVKLTPDIGGRFQAFCRDAGRSQQSVFAQMVAGFLDPAGGSTDKDLTEGLAEALHREGVDYQVALLDELQEKMVMEKLEQLQARKLARMGAKL